VPLSLVRLVQQTELMQDWARCDASLGNVGPSTTDSCLKVIQMKVFLSSTYTDLIPYRKSATEALERVEGQVDRMEIFGARPEDAKQASLRDLEESDLFVGIYAYRYGYVPAGSTDSITEQEFDYAAERNKQMFCFIVDENYAWLPGMIEDEPGKSNLKNFKSKINAKLVVDHFTTPEDLAVKVATAVARFRRRRLSEIHPTPSPEETNAAFAALLRQARSGNAEAMTELSLSDYPQKFEVLAAVLETNPQEAIREAAVNGLANLNDQRKIPLLGHTLVSEKWLVAAACAQALGRSRDAAAVPYLMRALQLRVDWLVAQKSAEALGYFEPTEAITKSLVKALNNGSFEGQAAKQSLVLHGRSSVPPLIENLSRAQSSEGLRFTIQALGIIGDQRAVSALEEMQHKIGAMNSTAKQDLQSDVSDALESLRQ
jgi:HEAT repeat protein